MLEGLEADWALVRPLWAKHVVWLRRQAYLDQVLRHLVDAMACQALRGIQAAEDARVLDALGVPETASSQ